MITKTGIEYSENSDLSNSSTIEENGTVNSINIPSWPVGTDLYCQAYVIEDGTRVNSSIEHYLPLNYFYLKNEYAGQNTITFTKHNSADNFEYSKNKSNWTTVSATTTVVMEEGEKVYLRTRTKMCDAGSWSWNINCSEIYSIGGNIKTLDCYYSAVDYYKLKFGSLTKLFQNSTTLVDASEVDMSTITTIEGSAMSNTFSGCTNLAKAPNMGSVKIIESSGLSGAFRQCCFSTIDLHSVETVRSGGLQNAFSVCAQLTTISIDNIKTIGDNGIYQTFTSCTSLTRGIGLRNVQNVPQRNNALYQMYAGCINLEEVTYPAVAEFISGGWETTSDWLRDAGTNVSGTKTAYVPTGMSIPYSTTGIPTGWTRVDY